MTPTSLTVRFSPSEVRAIDLFIRAAKPVLDHESRSRSGVIRNALLSLLRGDFDLSVGHADWSPNWGRLLSRPVDALSKTVIERRTVKISFRVSPGFVSDLDMAVKRRDFGSRTALIHAAVAAYLVWRSRPDTLVKSAYPPSVASVGSYFTVSLSGGNESERW